MSFIPREQEALPQKLLAFGQRGGPCYCCSFFQRICVVSKRCHGKNFARTKKIKRLLRLWRREPLLLFLPLLSFLFAFSFFCGNCPLFSPDPRRESKTSYGRPTTKTERGKRKKREKAKRIKKDLSFLPLSSSSSFSLSFLHLHRGYSYTPGKYRKWGCGGEGKKGEGGIIKINVAEGFFPSPPRMSSGTLPYKWEWKRMVMWYGGGWSVGGVDGSTPRGVDADRVKKGGR